MIAIWCSEDCTLDYITKFGCKAKNQISKKNVFLVRQEGSFIY